MLLLVLTSVTYGPGVGTPYFADDFQFVQKDGALLAPVLRPNSVNGFYRPVQGMFLAWVQGTWGWNTAPIAVTQIAMHLALASMIVAFMRRMDVPVLHAAIGGVFFAVAQVNVSAVLGNDTMSQVSSTLLSCVALWSLIEATNENGKKGTKRLSSVRPYAIAVSALLLALLSKETALGIVPVLVGLVGLAAWRIRGRVMSWQTCRDALPFVIVAGIYLLVRFATGAMLPQADGRYGVGVGPNVVRNAGLLLGAAMMPVSTVDAFLAWRERDTMQLALMCGGVIAFCIAIVWGLAHSERRGLIMGTSIALACSMFPVVLLNHVSELYVYGLMPLVAILVGCGIGTATVRVWAMGRPGVALGLGIWLLALAAGNGYGASKKVFQMRANGVRAMTLMDAVAGHVADVPRGGRVVLLNPADGSEEYSVFLVRGFNLLRYGEEALKIRSGRNDITVEIVGPGRWRPSAGMVLTVDGDAVRRVEPGEGNL
ncbi:MAG: hypothetical protein FJW23_14570 [Acidimicrobiia bacterium]|nr:hypothetical protein [Acidimicrobiia bacterium]